MAARTSLPDPKTGPFPGSFESAIRTERPPFLTAAITSRVEIAASVEELHTEPNKINKEAALDEKGNLVKGRGDEPNEHDILTGTQQDGTAFPTGEDRTCSNWTSNGDGSAMVGHHDLIGNPQNINFWNFSHPSRGCSQENLVGTGGAGLFYCFAAE